MTDKDHWLSKCPLAFQHNLTNLLHSTVCNSLLSSYRYLIDPPISPGKEGTYVVAVVIPILHMGKLRL